MESFRRDACWFGNSATITGDGPTFPWYQMASLVHMKTGVTPQCMFRMAFLAALVFPVDQPLDQILSHTNGSIFWAKLQFLQCDSLNLSPQRAEKLFFPLRLLHK